MGRIIISNQMDPRSPALVGDFVAKLLTEFKISVQNISLIEAALTHRSFVKQFGGQGHLDNERLEFLGDAVLKLVVSESVYKQLPGSQEGELTKRRARLVSDASCALYGESLSLANYLRVSTSEEKTGGRNRPSILGNAFEALLGAIYLDQGIGPASEFLLQVLDRNSVALSKEDNDYKTQLQEWLQKQQLSLPDYALMATIGPDHKKIFEIQATIRLQASRVISESGQGVTKKEAEQSAAKHCLERLKDQLIQ